MPGLSKNRNDKRWLNTFIEDSTTNKNNGLRVVGKLKLVALYRSATTCAKNQRPEPIGDLVPAPWHEVPVNVHRDVDGRMPHERLDPLRVLAVGDQQARVGVAEIMKPDLAQPRAPERRVETAVQQIAVVLRVARAVREYEIMSPRRALRAASVEALPPARPAGPPDACEALVLSSENRPAVYCWRT